MSSPPPIRRPRVVGRPLADFVAPALGNTMAARGFAAADIVLAWPEIVGERLAAVSQPVGLEWPRPKSGSEDAAGAAKLVLRVDGAHGLEIQHLAPVIIERANAYFGWRCVERLILKRGSISRTPNAAPKMRASAQAEARAAHAAAGIAHEGLRQALTRLGAEILD